MCRDVLAFYHRGLLQSIWWLALSWLWYDSRMILVGFLGDAIGWMALESDYESYSMGRSFLSQTFWTRMVWALRTFWPNPNPNPTTESVLVSAIAISDTNSSLPLSSTLLVRSGISSASVGWHCIRLVLCFELGGAAFGPGSEPDFPPASAPNILTSLLLSVMPSTLCRAIGHVRVCAMRTLHI